MAEALESQRRVSEAIDRSEDESRAMGQSTIHSKNKQEI